MNIHYKVNNIYLPLEHVKECLHGVEEGDGDDALEPRDKEGRGERRPLLAQEGLVYKYQGDGDKPAWGGSTVSIYSLLQ